MGRGILRGAGGDENLKFNFIWPYIERVGINTYTLKNILIEIQRPVGKTCIIVLSLQLVSGIMNFKL